MSFYFTQGQKEVIVNHKSFADMVNSLKAYSQRTNDVLDHLLARIQTVVDDFFVWVKYFVVVLVTATVIFTMFLTVSMQFFFEKDYEIDRMDEVDIE